MFRNMYAFKPLTAFCRHAILIFSDTRLRCKLGPSFCFSEVETKKESMDLPYTCAFVGFYYWPYWKLCFNKRLINLTLFRVTILKRAYR